MEKYRLKQWYPNLHLAWSTTDNYEYDREDNRMYNRTRWGTISITPPYLHSDFWELIEEKKPLFVTEDGTSVFDKDEYYSIGVGFKAIRMRALEHGTPYSSDVKRFKHESNAYEYIWRNKRVFSYEDMMKAKHSILITNEDIEISAKERS